MTLPRTAVRSSSNPRSAAAVRGGVRDGLDEGTLAVRGDPRIVAYGLLGMLAWTNRWFRPDADGPDAAEVAATFAATVIDGLVARPDCERRPERRPFPRTRFNRYVDETP